MLMSLFPIMLKKVAFTCNLYTVNGKALIQGMSSTKHSCVNGCQIIINVRDDVIRPIDGFIFFT